MTTSWDYTVSLAVTGIFMSDVVLLPSRTNLASVAFVPARKRFVNLGPVSRNSRELFGPEKSVVKLWSTGFHKLILQHVFNPSKA